MTTFSRRTILAGGAAIGATMSAAPSWAELVIDVRRGNFQPGRMKWQVYPFG